MCVSGLGVYACVDVWLVETPYFFLPCKSVNTAWCSEIGSLTPLDACNSGASSDVREPVSMHLAVLQQFSGLKSAAKRAKFRDLKLLC